MMMMVCSFRFIRRAALLALLGKKVVERQSSRSSICKKRTFRINNTLNMWTKKRTFLVQFRPRSSKPTPLLFFALSCLLFRLWRSFSSLLEIASKREREGDRDRASSSRLHTHHRHRRRAKGFTTKEKHSKAFSFVFPEKRDVKERRISQQKSHIIMRDFAARASTSFAEGACCVTFFPSREVRSARRDRPTMTTTFVVYVQNHNNNNNNNNGHKNERIPLGKKGVSSHFLSGCFLSFLISAKENHHQHQHHQPFFFARKKNQSSTTKRRPGDQRTTNEARGRRRRQTPRPFPLFFFFFP